MESYSNPYVGPRTFTRDEGHLYFGREREARELRDRVISERLVLFYAQSGAGKSSLINTRLIPQLQAENFTVLPRARISGALPLSVKQVDNIFSFNLMLSLDQTQGEPNRFNSMSLNHFFAHLASDDGEHWYYDENAKTQSAQNGPDLSVPYVLIIDQFEELITHHPERWPERAQFFQQLNQAMLDDPNLWVVLTLREDYVASLDPYAPLIENRLRARFYMQRMRVDAALEAIQKPAAAFGRPFAPNVAEKLVDNLRRVQIIGKPSQVVGTIKGSEYTGALGEFIEPVQLQTVCYQLWENLQPRQLSPITEQDLQEAGNIDRALTVFYERTIGTVLAKMDHKVTERKLRKWFSQQLITEAETRGLVYQGNNQTGDIPNELVKELERCFLLRSEIRGGGTWIELVHDRFISPILMSNQKWMENEEGLWLADASTTKLDSLSGSSKQIALAMAELKPFQALEYDPRSESSLLITEWVIPYEEGDQLNRILAQRKSNEKFTIRRYDESYKVALIRQISSKDQGESNYSEEIYKRLVYICRNLAPFQALEFDPQTNSIILITEWLIPYHNAERIYDIIARRKKDEKITIRRFEENYKVALVKRMII